MNDSLSSVNLNTIADALNAEYEARHITDDYCDIEGLSVSETWSRIAATVANIQARLPHEDVRPANPLDRILSKRPPLYQTNHLPDRKICGVVDYRGRVCGNWNGHDGPHNFVPRTVRED